MKGTLNARCTLFIQNRDVIKSEFAWENSYFYPICASVFVNAGKNAEAETLEYCFDLIREKTGIFSEFRNYAKLSMISMMSIENNPKDMLERSLQVYAQLKQHFWSSAYLPIASMLIAKSVDAIKYDSIAERTRHIYELVRAEHPFLTGEEDSVLCALLAVSELSDEEIVEETERCYDILKPEFFSANAVQALSHVLALSPGKSEEKCGRVLALYNELRKLGYKYGTDYELATLGFAGEVNTDIKALADDIIEVDEYLSAQKGYGFFGLGKRQRLMHAAMIVAGEAIDENAISASAVTGVISQVAAQNATMCAAIAASVTASVAAANANR